MSVYSFDDGTDEALLTRVARGYLELLAPLGTASGLPPGPRGPYIKTLRQLPIDPTAELILDETAVQYFGALPGAYVVLGGASAFASQPDLLKWDQTVRVYCASASPGRLVHGRLHCAADQPGQDPGMFTMVQHVIEQLHYAALPGAPYVGLIRVEDHEPVYSAQSLSIWLISTQVRIQQAINQSRDTPPIDRIVTNHAPAPTEPIASQRRDF